MLRIYYYIDITTPEIILTSGDKGTAITIIGTMKRLVIFGWEIFNKKTKTFTGKVYKLIGKMSVEILDKCGMQGLESAKTRPENVIWYNPDNFEPYEYELVAKFSV